jgi:hypothetical protein
VRASCKGRQCPRCKNEWAPTPLALKQRLCGGCRDEDDRAAKLKADRRARQASTEPPTATQPPVGRRVSPAELLELCGYGVTVLELPNGQQLIRIDGVAAWVQARQQLQCEPGRTGGQSPADAPHTAANGGAAAG